MFNPVNNYSPFYNSGSQQAPVCNAAPSKDPVHLSRCLSEVAAQAAVAATFAGGNPVQRGAAAAANALLHWYTSDKCPSVYYMAEALKSDVQDFLDEVTISVRDPLYFMSYPKEWWR